MKFCHFLQEMYREFSKFKENYQIRQKKEVRYIYTVELKMCNKIQGFSNKILFGKFVG